MSFCRDNELSTNRGNHLLIHLMKTRFPNIFHPEQINRITKILSQPIDKSMLSSAKKSKSDTNSFCLFTVNTSNSSDELSHSLLLSYVSENSKQYPLLIGEDYTGEQRNQMSEYLVRKHFLDFKSTHCTPLPSDYFRIPWDLPNVENDFIFT